MNTRLIVALTSVLAATACANTNSKPAEEPSTPTSDPSTTSARTYPASSTANGSITTGPGSASDGVPATAYDRTTNTTPNAGSSRTTTQTTTAPVPAAPADTKTSGVVAEPPTKNVDNTRVNERDREGTLTPMNQGNSKSEIQITATIRRGIVADKTLGFDAKNVKVITTGTKVTLRGPVKTEQEKAAIGALAKQTAGVTEVDNQLEIKK